MGYCIQYDKTTGAMEIQRTRRFQRKSILIFFILLAIVAAFLLPKTRQVLKKVLLPGDETVTAQALEDLVTDLRQGSGVSQAVEAFCREIIEHG